MHISLRPDGRVATSTAHVRVPSGFARCVEHALSRLELPSAAGPGEVRMQIWLHTTYR
ncbi:MAG: hypothetical protein KC657_00160 [Myxococcales bacterium]|nr:hypothetical protein [Myxococcales bacterium]